MPFCSKCGSPIPDGSSFCTNCGAPINQQNPDFNYQQQPQYSQPQYSQPQYNQPAPIHFGQRNIAVAIILSIVTCGIYDIIWLINMVNELNEASGDTNATSGGMVFLLSLVTCGIYLYIWLYKASEKINYAKGMRGLGCDSNSGILYILLAIFGLGIVSYALIQNELNTIAAYHGAPKA